MRTLLVTICLSLFSTLPTLASEGFYNFDGEGITLYRNTYNFQDATLSSKIDKAIKKEKHDSFHVDKKLRGLILKDLNINEDDYVSFKYFGKTETLSLKVSELKLYITRNDFGVDSPSLGNITLEVPKTKDRGIAFIDKNNPFNDKTRFDRVMPAKGVYWINPKINLIEEVTRTEKNEKDQNESGFENGSYKFKVQIDKQEPDLIATFDVETDSYVRGYHVYGGDILKDGSALIYISGFNCGSFIVIKGKESKVTHPPCGAMGC